MKELGRGAEAIVTVDGDNVTKNRISKGYRLKKLDDDLRFSRTKREAKILEKLAKIGVNAPKLIEVKDSTVVMSHLDGLQLKDALSTDNYQKYAELIGTMVTKLHQSDIIHGDLTTSNMIVLKDDLYLIDFGLSFVSPRVEDKAVDLHLLRQALESKHFDICSMMFELVLEHYNPQNKAEIMTRFEKVESRGRNKNK